MLRFAAAVAASTILLVPCGAAAAAEHPGSLDTRIATLGGERIDALAATPDHRILVAGGPPAYPGTWTRVRAYLPDGTLDGGFGDKGAANFGAERGEAVAMRVDPDGHIVVGLTGSNTVHRLTPDGHPDETFGTGGRVDLGFTYGGNAQLSDLVMQPDGRILVVGTPGGYGGYEKSLALSRYLPGGAPDPSFGTNGELTLPTGDPNTKDARLLLQPSGQIVVFVRSYGDRPVRIARLSANGSVDPSFGPGGLAELEFGDPSRAPRALPSQRSDWRPLILPGGRIRIPVTFDMLERPNRMALVGLTANGHPDLGFGRDGLAIGPRLRRAEEPEAVIGDERGGIIVAGSLRTSDDFGFDSRGVIRRFARDGTLDRSFGRDGLVRGALEGGGYTVIEQRLAFLDGETLVAAEDSFDGKYGFCCGATLRTLNAGYDTDDPSISLVAGCHRMRVSITDLSGMGKVVVRAGGHVIRRTDRKRFGVRLRPSVRRISVRATDLAGNTSTRKLLRPRC